MTVIEQLAKLEVGGWFEVEVSAYSPDYNTDRIERRFRFYYDENEAPMFFRPESL